MTALRVETPSLRTLTGLLTAPYRRGAESVVLALGADTTTPAGAVETAVTDDDFAEYKARYGADPPDPRYVFFVAVDVGDDALDVEFEFGTAGTPEKRPLRVPAGTVAGTSFLIPPPDHPALRMAKFRHSPPLAAGTGAENFAVVALLGNIARMAWVLGWEKDQIRRHLRDVQRQRYRAFAHGRSLDLLGADLRVPRFPAREHSYDPDTLALYHLNAIVPVPSGGGATAPGVADEVPHTVGGGKHPGVIEGTVTLAVGKFDRGLGFPAAPGTGGVVVAHDAAFDVASGKDFTAEAFVNIDPPAAPTVPAVPPAPAVVLVKGALAADGALTATGWALSVGQFRGLSSNVRWAVRVGGATVEVFADLNIADGRFHHLAGVLDQSRRRLRLLVDGQERGNEALPGSLAVANTNPVRIGSSAADTHVLAGVVDEVRLSKAARTDFHPVLGEGDAAYRQRLGIFERFLLPTPKELLRAINGLVRIDNQPDSFVLLEEDQPGAAATATVRVAPATLPAGQSIDRDGVTGGGEAAACGTAADDADFRPQYLVTYTNAAVEFAGAPDPLRIQVVVRDRLDALVGLLSAVAGKLRVERAYAPAGPGLHAVGRALELSHPGRTPAALAVLAHRAGFEFVRNDAPTVRVAVAAGELIGIAAAPPGTPPAGVDLFPGEVIDLSAEPTGLAPTGQFRWSLILCGAGSGTFRANPTDPASGVPAVARPRLQFAADSPGEVTVQVEYTHERRTVSGSRTLRVGLANLEDKSSITAAGDRRATELAAVGPPDAPVKPLYLITSNVSGVDYGTAANRRMQVALERRFLALIAAKPGLATGLKVTKGFDPVAKDYFGAGRALVLTHATVGAGELGALAHRVGFGFVRRDVNDVYCSVPAGEKLEIVVVGSNNPLPDELALGKTVTVTSRPDVSAPAGSYHWTLEPVGGGAATLLPVTGAGVKFGERMRLTATGTGPAAVSVAYFEQQPEKTLPYTFEIRLKPSLDTADQFIPKHQYDLIMNVLNYFHPIGVEVVTANLRKHVRELGDDPTKAAPAYTFPDFRA